jgi:hypothetical protein
MTAQIQLDLFHALSYTPENWRSGSVFMGPYFYDDRDDFNFTISNIPFIYSNQHQWIKTLKLKYFYHLKNEIKHFFYKHNEICLWSNQNKWNISSISTMKYFCDQIKTNEIFLPQTYWNYNISFTYFKEIRFVQQDKHSYCFSPLSTIFVEKNIWRHQDLLDGDHKPF